MLRIRFGFPLWHRTYHTGVECHEAARRRTLLEDLKACSASRDLERGRKLHREAIEGNLHTDVYVATSLLHMYGKCGSMALAQQVFDGMRNRSVVSWNALITGYVENGQCSLALEIFQRVDQAPNAGTYTAAFMACSGLAEEEEWQQPDRSSSAVKIKILEQGMEIHSKKIAEEIEGLFADNALIDLYINCGSLLDARVVFDRMKLYDVVSWNCLILGYVQHGFPELAHDLFNQMENLGVEPDSRTFVAALLACSPQEQLEVVDKSNCLEKVLALHSKAAAAGLIEGQIFAANTLIDLYGKCGSAIDARMLFDRMARHSIVSWNALLMGYVDCGESDLAMELFSVLEQNQERGIRPNSVTYLAALKACVDLATEREEQDEGDEDEQVEKLKLLEKAMSIHCRLSRDGSGDIFLESTLIELYSKCGSLYDARRVFDSMPRRNLVSWNATVVACIKNGEPDFGVHLLNEISNSKLFPDAQLIVSALTAITNLNRALENQSSQQMPKPGICLGRQIHGLACRWGLETNQFIASTAIALYGISSYAIAAAQHVFDSSTSSIACWNSLITSYSIHGDCETVLDLFSRMREESTNPDDITLLAVLTACSRSGLANEARAVLMAMEDKYNVKATKRHFSCVVDALAKAGCGSEAVELLKQIPVPADPACWMAVLGSCRQWQDVVSAEVAFKELMRIQRKLPVAYVLMANTYAMARKEEQRFLSKS